jgi:glycosyltransferase involved in cell wall biosynthesis
VKLKVVHIVTRLDFGGAQQNTLYTVRHLDRTKFSPVLYCGAGGTLADWADQLQAPVVVFEDLVREVSPWRDLAALLRMARHLRKERPDVVHTHSSKAGILGRCAAWLAGVPLIIHTFHGFGFHERQSPLLKWAYILSERFAACLSHKLIFVAQANMEYAARYNIGNSAAYELIRSGIALSTYPRKVDIKAVRAAAGIRRDPPLVLSIGNLKAQKNPEDFLKVAEAVCAKIPRGTFVFIGDGPLRNKLEARVMLKGLSQRVQFIGWREDAAQLLAAADIFLMTSLWEGLPRALLEAMQSGLPCVAYNVDGIADVLRDNENGFAITAGDWGSAAQRVTEILEQPELGRRLGEKARTSLSEEFDIDGMVRRQERLLGDLAGPNS